MIFRFILYVFLALWAGLQPAAAAQKKPTSGPADVQILYTTDTRAQIKCKG